MKRCVVILALAAFAARADGIDVEPDQVLVTVRAEIDGKPISATTRSLEWHGLALAPGKAQVHVRLRIDLIGAADFEGVVADGRFTGVFTILGEPRPLTVPVEVVRKDGQLVLRAEFEIEPRGGSRISVQLFARVQVSPGAVLSGGAWHGV